MANLHHFACLSFRNSFNQFNHLIIIYSFFFFVLSVIRNHNSWFLSVSLVGFPILYWPQWHRQSLCRSIHCPAGARWGHDHRWVLGMLWSRQGINMFIRNCKSIIIYKYLYILYWWFYIFQVLYNVISCISCQTFHNKQSICKLTNNFHYKHNLNIATTSRDYF